MNIWSGLATIVNYLNLFHPFGPSENSTATSQRITNNVSDNIISLKPNFTDSPYTHHLIMDPDGKFHLYWYYDNTNVTFEIRAKARGWVALGFSPNGGMADADIVHAYFDSNGHPHLSDRFSVEALLPTEDKHQDYTLLGGSKNNTHMNVSFTRRHLTCDKEDMPLTNNTIRGIYAFSDKLPVHKNNFQSHEPTERGAKSLRLFQNQVIEKPITPDVKHLDFVLKNVEIPDDYHTLYYCQIFALPNWTKHHLIRVDPLIQKENNMIVHHILLYWCKTDMSQYVDQGGEPCFDRSGYNMSVMTHCYDKYLAGWAVGAGPIIYPENVGLPMFGADSHKHVLLEIHYDNSAYLRNKIDSSGLRLHLTETLRQNEAGSMVLAVPVGAETMIIPAGQEQFTQYTYCYSECTSWFPKDGLSAFSAVLHTHLAGRKIRVHHIRNGVQLEDLFVDEHYDFNFQALIMKQNPVKILPGDEFIVECVYNTSSNSESLYGGWSTREEMCMAFIDIYPRLEPGEIMCLSNPSYIGKEWKELFNANYNLDLDRFTMGNGSFLTARQFAETQVKFPNEVIVSKFQANVRNGDHSVLCSGGKNKSSPGNASEDIWLKFTKQGPPNITVPLKIVNVCSNGVTSTTRLTGLYFFFLLFMVVCCVL